MTFNGSKELIVYYVVQLHLKTTLLGSCRGDIFGILTSTEQNMELLIFISLIKWTHRGISTWKVELIASYFIKSFWVEQFASSISTAGKHHSEVSCHCYCEDLMSVNIFCVNNGTSLNVISQKPSSVGAIVNCLIKRSPLYIIYLMVFWTLDLLDTLEGSSLLLSSKVNGFLSTINSNI